MDNNYNNYNNNNNANFQQYYQPNQNGGYPPNNNNNSGPLWLKIFIPSLASVAIVLVILFATGVIKPNNTLQSTPVPVSEVTQETTSATTAAPQVVVITSIVTVPVEQPPTEVVVVPAQPTTARYSSGRYQVSKANLLYVRTGPGQNYSTVPFYSLSADAQSQIRKRMGGNTANGLVKGCVCDVKYTSGNWGKIPSGWICLDYCTKIG